MTKSVEHWDLESPPPKIEERRTIMKGGRTWFLYPLLALLLAFSLVGMAAAQTPLPHVFYGSLLIATEPAPAGVEVEARGTGIMTGIDGNPITTIEEGKYGGPGPFDPKLIVQGDIQEGAPIEFYVDGVRAKCREAGAAAWQDTYPWHSGGETELDLSVPGYTLEVTSDGCCPILLEYTPSVGSSQVVTGTVPAGQSEEFADIPRDTQVHLSSDDSDVCCEFVQWVVDSGTPITATKSITITMDSDHAAVATCSVPGPFTLTVEAEPPEGGTVEGSGTYSCCTYVPITATANSPCWYFTDWTGEGISDTTSPTTTVHVDKDKRVAAHFAKYSYDLTVTVEPPEGGTVEGSGTYSCCTYVPITATANSPCWGFTGWIGEGISDPTSPATTVHMDADKVVTATFSQLGPFTLTVSTVGQGGVDLNPPQPTEGYTCCTEVQATAVPSDCWEFAGWTGDIITTTNPITVHMDADKAITATFSELGPYTLTVEAEPPEGGTVEGSGTYSCCTYVPITATANSPCWEFTGWIGEGISDPTSPATTVHMDADKVITATFSQLGPFTLTVDITPQGGGDVMVNGQIPPSYPMTETFDCCTEVGLEAVPAEGYEFVEWTGDVTGTEITKTIHMASHKTVTAHFAEKPVYTIFLPMVAKNYSPPNQPPSVPSDPAPADGAQDQPLDLDLSWTGGDPDGDEVIYDVYFGTSCPPSDLACEGVSSTVCDPGPLHPVTQYFWYVIARDNHCAESRGPVAGCWSFTTYCCLPSEVEPTCGWCEPNNWEERDSWGPLCPGMSYEALLCSGDPTDYYYIDLSIRSHITIALDVPDGVDYDLYLYNSQGEILAFSANFGSADEHIEYDPASSGRYYVRVYPYSEGSDTKPYILTASYEWR